MTTELQHTKCVKIKVHSNTHLLTVQWPPIQMSLCYPMQLAE